MTFNIRELEDVISKLDTTEELRKISNKDWRTWSVLSETSSFINFLLLRKLELTRSIMDTSLNNENSISLCSETKGRCDQIEEIMDCLKILIEGEEKENEGKKEST
jgi:hypothetical protein